MKKSIPLSWRRIPSRYRLEGTQCLNCKSKFFPPRSICPTCRRKGKIDQFTFNGLGKIHSYSTIYVPPEGFERNVPYILAIVELEEGAKITGEIVDVEEKEVAIGKKVKMVFRKLQQDDPEGIIHYGFKFKLVE